VDARHSEEEFSGQWMQFFIMSPKVPPSGLNLFAGICKNPQNLAQRLRRLPSLLIAEVGIAHGGANVLMPGAIPGFRARLRGTARSFY
jgi:hypothetical protein